MGPLSMVGAHANGATLVMYEGAPDFPEPDRVWASVERHGVNMLGVSPTLIRALRTKGAEWRPQARPQLAAHPRLDRRAVEPRALQLARPRGRRRPRADHQPLRRHRGRRVLPVAVSRSSRSRCARSAAIARDGHGRLRRRRQQRARRGRRARLQAAVAGDDARRLEGPRALPRAPTGRSTRTSGATATGRGSTTTASGSCSAAPTRRSTSRASASARPRSSPIAVGHPGVAEAACVGVPDDVKGEAVWCFWVAGRRGRRGRERRDRRARRPRARAAVQAVARGARRRAAEDAQRRRSCAARCARSPWARTRATSRAPRTRRRSTPSAPRCHNTGARGCFNEHLVRRSRGIFRVLPACLFTLGAAARRPQRRDRWSGRSRSPASGRRRPRSRRP